MKRILFNLKNNKGSGIVTVLVAILFLTAFGTLSMYLAYTSTQMVASERKGKEASYNAETCMDEIKAGLQITVSDAIAQSYNTIMPKYTSYNQDISNEFNKLYLDAVLGAKVINYDLTVNPEDEEESEESDAANKIVYYDEKMFSITKTSDGYDSVGTYDGNQLARLVKEPRDGTCRVYTKAPADGEDTSIGTLELTDKEIVLKDVTVSYEEAGRKSSVTSDISIGIPNLGYLMTQYSISGIPDFSLICKGELIQGKNDAGNVTAKIYGNAYANKVTLKNDNKMEIGNGATMVVKETIDINGIPSGDRLNTRANTTIWAKDIKVGSGSSVNLSGKTYLNNDFEFTGSNAKAKLSGVYYGFGCDPVNPSNSSSIIFNKATESNAKNELNISGLTDLVLAGVSFVSNSGRFMLDDTSFIGEAAKLYDSDDDTNPAGGVTSDDIGSRTGMSMDVKFNQIIYFAPKGQVTPYKLRTFIWDVNNDDDGTTEKTTDNKTLIYMISPDGDDTSYYAEATGTGYNFYKLTEGDSPQIVPATGVTYNPQVEPGTLVTDADGMTFYTENMLKEVAYFALNGEEYIYNTTKKTFELTKNSEESLPSETGLSGKAYSDYGITLMPVYQYLSNYTYQITFFMKFNDVNEDGKIVTGSNEAVASTAQNNANQFFFDYFNANDNNKEKIINNIESYTNIIASESTNRRTAGNTLINSSSGYEIVRALEAAFNSIKNEADFIKGIFDQYCISLSSQTDIDYSAKSDEFKQNPNPFDYYVKVDKINEDISGESGKIKFYNTTNNGPECTAVVVKGNYSYPNTSDGNSIHIIIATGDVTVTGSYNGLILSGGDIILDGNCVLNKYAEGVAIAYSADSVTGDHVHDSTGSVNGQIDRLLKDYLDENISQEYLYSSSSSGDAWNVEGLVTYKNWHR